MSDAILVLNAGSSSIKFSLFPGHEQPTRQDIICDGECEGIGQRIHFAAKDGAGRRSPTNIGRLAKPTRMRLRLCFAGLSKPFRRIG